MASLLTPDPSPTHPPDRRTSPDDKLQLELLVGSVKDYAIFMLDLQGYVATWNLGAETIKGYRAEEVRGEHISIFYTPEDRRAGLPARLLDQAAREGRVENEGWRVRKDGTRFWADVVITAVRDATGTSLGYGKVTRDLTQRKRAEDMLATAGRQQTAVAELGRFALESRDLERVMQRGAETAAATLDVPLVEVCRLDAITGILAADASVGFPRPPPPRRSSEPCPAALAVRTAEPVFVEDLTRDPRFEREAHLQEEDILSGAWVAIQASGGSAEAPTGTLGVHTREVRRFSSGDLDFLQSIANILGTAAARARAETAVLAAEQSASAERLRAAQAEVAVTEREEFISIAAHELRTPLTALKLKLQGVQELLRSRPGEATPEKLRARLDTTVRQVDRLNRLTERLLDVTRIAADRLELLRDLFDLGELVHEVAESFREEAVLARCELTVTIPGPIPACLDRSRIEQAVANVLSNAIKYGAGKPVEVSVERADDLARVRVTDHGIGLDPGDSTRIFDRFSRAAPFRNYGGLGLGLYIARHVIQAHGGRIAVQSRRGEGATFEIEVPLSEQGALTGPPAGARAP